MRNIAMVALMIPFGVASSFAQPGSVQMTLSGTAAASTISLRQDAPTSEYQLAGSGTLGKFDLRVVSATIPSPQPSSTCSGPTKFYGAVVGGGGVFRFNNGDLLRVNLTGGSDCIDFVAGKALCIRIFQITGGTGRFDTASGNITLTMVVAPAVGDAANNPVLFTVTAGITGDVPRAGSQQGQQ